MTASVVSASGRADLPVLRQVDVELPAAEHARLSQLAARLLKNEAALSEFAVFGRQVSPGLDDAPALLFEDHSEIKLFSRPVDAALRRRSLLLAGDGDLVLVDGHRDLAFEEYCRDVVGLGAPRLISLPLSTSPIPLSLPRRCAMDQRAFEIIVDTARAHGRLNLIPYIGTGSAWKLASQIASASGARIKVAAPPPRLTQRVNDKLWFDQRVTEVLGKDAQPPNYHAFGPAAVAARVAALARRSERVVIKVPDSAGSAGNIVLDSAVVRRLSLSKVRRRILALLHSRGWHSDFPLQVGIWDCAVLSSPSVQIWVPLADQGLPVIEGLFDQLVRGAEGEFIGAVGIGATTSELPAQLRQRLATEAMQLACLFQQLGYFGRCSFDAIISGTHWPCANVRWIECNGRWGGTSIPMTLANRLVGNWTQRAMMIVQRGGLAIRGCDLPTALDRLGTLLYRRDGDGTGVIVVTPGRLEEGSGLNFLLLGHDASQLQTQMSQIESLFVGQEETGLAS